MKQSKWNKKKKETKLIQWAFGYWAMGCGWIKNKWNWVLKEKKKGKETKVGKW